MWDHFERVKDDLTKLTMNIQNDNFFSLPVSLQLALCAFLENSNFKRLLVLQVQKLCDVLKINHQNVQCPCWLFQQIQIHYRLCLCR